MTNEVFKEPNFSGLIAAPELMHNFNFFSRSLGLSDLDILLGVESIFPSSTPLNAVNYDPACLVTAVTINPNTFKSNP